ncbi:MAG: hypothetical protein A2504_03765 [Bdellovibrionales bacterium RIFOXYD12_FULL_39_22]|nr:MAG: hypothetical protein A2385_11515 [Bdellovibrionales bacterium RIFOXYB1_FULL_39_21]OFZ41693.1 MAG: hypothetical protein A2485_01825 [Bdellovibrionales bacterium RIFOXYC12_FULL_39_17]OFZ46093.1 MAG: hypothetical protein A2404_12190 [Bdellovibrionales bacterium RIFOXYC1_FULL_39_130]OFZ74920.1 MAG: hypothetical protein A2560_15230 [Bdellovibrionales bacterium RIFOXYD1_FULL_39_84]OFZ75152.1 MAG: hypothetical protein A2451_15295 [Bdellovibrionales bacterium RIFOXYC2_FULL_39_8]OFZ92773.1 MAG:
MASTPQQTAEINLTTLQRLLVQQRHELGEWIGFETRNKYEILDEQKRPIGFAAEQQKGFWGFIMRSFLGHWRTFDIYIFNINRELSATAHHPFRWYFERIEVRDAAGKSLGAIQKKFSILSKKFDVENSTGATIMEVSSPIWRIWSFPFMRNGKKLAEINKKWSGFLSEALTDRDNFIVEFSDTSMNNQVRTLIVAAAIFVDLSYFERKKS